MSVKPPVTDLPIKTAESGFYAGFAKNVAISSKVIITLLVVWAIAFPDQASSVLNGFNSFILSNFATWYVWVMASFVLVCILLSLWPSAGRLKLGHDQDKPEFSNFSWFSMMFGAGILFALVVIMGASTLSALSGVGKGIKWLSNLNMGLSIFLLLFFLLFGSTFFGLQALIFGMVEYLIALPAMMFTVWKGDGTEGSVATLLEGWQGAWSVFYWAWWIAFAPFVGLFLARISKGRTIREFVLGAVIVPAIMCFIWFTWAGGTAIDLELTGVAGGAINSAPDGAKIFVMVDVLLGEFLGWLMAILIVVLLMTYLVTSADSAVLIVNTINAAGDEGPKARPHIIFWGVALGAVVGALLLIGGLGAIQTAMVIGALPFSVVMVLMCISLIKAIYRDGLRERGGLQTIHVDEPASPAE